MTNPARISSAVHEVGHALVAWRLGLSVGTLRIGMDGDDWAGKADIGDAEHLRLIEQLAICVAGLEAQELAGCASGELREHGMMTLLGPAPPLT